VVRLLLQKVNFERNVLATLLPAIAGAINASGFFAVGMYTSHMTGLVSRAGDSFAEHQWWLGSRVLLFLGCFIGGAMTATALVLYARKRQQPAFWRPMLLEAAVLFVFASITVGSGHGRGAHLNSFAMTSILCFGMGVQNALVTKLSGARMRTTHLTGVSTDIGIELMKTVLHWHDLSAHKPLAQRLSLLPEVGAGVEAQHLRLHLRILLCFLLGATGGAALYLVVGHWSMLIPVLLLCGLAVFDLRLGLGSSIAAATPDLAS
jgi:uncharacterized membrane protein YoaK (UPF0700 family)